MGGSRKSTFAQDVTILRFLLHHWPVESTEVCFFQKVCVYLLFQNLIVGNKTQTFDVLKAHNVSSS